MPFTGTVLQVIPALDAGGAERTTVEISRAIVDAGGKSFVVSAGGRLEKEIEDQGGGVFRMPAASKNPLQIWRNGDTLRSIIRQHKVDILHVRSRAPAWSALRAARAEGIRLVSTWHGAYNAGFAIKRLYNSGLGRADLVIANSAFTAESILKHYAFNPKKLVTIPRGADLTAFDPSRVSPSRVEALMTEWGLSKNQRRSSAAPSRAADFMERSGRCNRGGGKACGKITR